MRHIPDIPIRVVTLSAMLFGLTLAPGQAEESIRFTVVEQQENTRHISMIPESGYDGQGHLKDSHNPNSIIYQHARMVDQLRRENRELMLTEEEQNSTGADREIEEELIKLPGNIFSEGTESKTVLDELIELEKRAGRASPDGQRE